MKTEQAGAIGSKKSNAVTGSMNSEASTADSAAFLVEPGEGKTVTEYTKGSKVFSQGDVAESVFHIRRGRVKLSIVSLQGKEAVIALLGPGDFFGEACLAGENLQVSSATALADIIVLRVDKEHMLRALQEQPALSTRVMSYLLMRKIRVEEDLVDQIFNSSEKRLARTLLLLANFANDGAPEAVIARISQETLAEMVGTTRSRVSFFMNKFRRLGLIEYNGHLRIRSSLLSIFLQTK
jgi:CRP-like cAMP-binding protein